MSNLNQRRNYYIKKEFQNMFIIKFCILMIFACFAFGVLVYCLAQGSVTTAFVDSRLVIKSTADFILPFLGLTGLMVIIAIGAATVATVKRMSHSLAGPLYRFEQQFTAMKSGDFSKKLILRDSDQLKNTAEELNDMLVSVSDQMKRIRKNVKAVEHEMDKDNERLVEYVHQLKKDVEFFRV